MLSSAAHAMWGKSIPRASSRIAHTAIRSTRCSRLPNGESNGWLQPFFVSRGAWCAQSMVDLRNCTHGVSTQHRQQPVSITSPFTGEYDVKHRIGLTFVPMALCVTAEGSCRSSPMPVSLSAAQPSGTGMPRFGRSSRMTYIQRPIQNKASKIQR